MQRGKLIICEPTPHWIISLRWSWTQASDQLVEVAQLADCACVLQRLPASLVALDCVGWPLSEVLAWIRQTQASFPLVHLVVLLDREHRHQEWLLREAGAVHVLIDTRQLDTLISLYLRHQAALPDIPTSLRESIWEQLPWPPEG